MKKTEVIQRIRDTGLIPVVRAESAELAMRAVEAITAGGVDVLEVTMTVPGAIDVIAKLAATFGTEVVIGAGTVLDPDTADKCLQAGAQFIVSPALNEATILFCRRNDVAQRKQIHRKVRPVVDPYIKRWWNKMKINWSEAPDAQAASGWEIGIGAETHRMTSPGMDRGHRVAGPDLR